MQFIFFKKTWVLISRLIFHTSLLRTNSDSEYYNNIYQAAEKNATSVFSTDLFMFLLTPFINIQKKFFTFSNCELKNMKFLFSICQIFIQLYGNFQQFLYFKCLELNLKKKASVLNEIE